MKKLGLVVYTGILFSSLALAVEPVMPTGPLAPDTKELPALQFAKVATKAITHACHSGFWKAEGCRSKNECDSICLDRQVCTDENAAVCGSSEEKTSLVLCYCHLGL